MTTGQGSDIDLVVPPAVPPWRRWLILTVAFLALAGVLVLPASGLLAPRLSGLPRDVCTTGCPAGVLVQTFELRNEGWLPAEVRAIDATAPGLGTASVAVQPIDAPYDDGEGPLVPLPAHLDPGRAVLVHLTYDALDCTAIQRQGRRTVPVSATGPLGLAVTVDVRPGEFSEWVSGVRTFTGEDPLGHQLGGRDHRPRVPAPLTDRVDQRHIRFYQGLWSGSPGYARLSGLVATQGRDSMPAQKADFTDIYTQPDPRAYYRTLRALDYEIPEHGRGVFDAVLDELRGVKESPVVLDVCCSYGINAALLNHAVTLDEIEEHYAAAEGLSRPELIELDRAWYAARRSPDAVDVVGFDVSQPAVDYAVEAGLLVDGVVADLERDALTGEDVARISGVDLVTVTGGVGYVMDRTFDQILAAAEEPPWVAALTLRWIDFEPIAETLDAHGLVTEKLDGYVVPQRRFVDAGEERFVIDQLTAQGIEPTEVERNGHHGAELYLARPAGHVAELPLSELLLSVSDPA